MVYQKRMRQWTPTEIEEFRRTYKLTRKALGELLGVTVPTIFRWERGLRAPSKTTKLLLKRVEQDLKRRKEVKEK
jgi:DNA-binding transcriptional regulator YiaG